MPITLDPVIVRNDGNTIDMNTPYSDVNIKSGQITDDMVSHLETQIQKAEDDFNNSVQADITAVTNAKDVAVASALASATSESNALASSNSSTASATASYNSSVTSGTSASEALVSANNASTSETNADISEANALASASTATNASVITVDAKDIVTTLASQVALDTVTTVNAKDEAVLSATDAQTSADNALASETASSDSADASSLSATQAELAAQNAEQSALVATDFIGYKGDWDPGETYNIGDTVSFGRLLYACKLNGVTIISPEHIQNTAEWFFLGRDHNKYIVIDATYIAENQDYIFLQATTTFTVSLPVVHTLNDQITFYTGETSEDFNITIDGNGSLVRLLDTADTSIIADTNGIEFKLISNGTDWRVIV